jgi:uncharacterized protein YoxC
MLWEISLVIIGIAFLVLVIFAVPTLRQLRHTAKSVENTTNSLNQKLPEILENIQNVSLNVSETTGGIRTQIDNISGIVNAVQSLINSITNFEKSFRREIEHPIMEFVHTLNALVKGARTFVETWRGE